MLSPFFGKHRTTVERKSERELAVTRTFDSPARIVFEASSNVELFKAWWVPKSAGLRLVSCEADVRTGGTYRFEFAHGDATMAFFGRYLDVVTPKRIVWTNEESDEGAVTTVTFEEKNGKTLLTLHELYPSREARDAAMEGSAAGLPEQFEQLDALLVTRGTGGRRS